MSFVVCKANEIVIDQLLSLLESSAARINRETTKIIKEIDDAVTLNLLGTVNEVNDAALAIADSIEGLIPDYTDKLKNTGAALLKYENDFNEFYNALKQCSSSQMKAFLRTLGLDVPIPNLPDSQMVTLGFSLLRDSMRLINSFPIEYLRSQSDNIVFNLYADVLSTASNLKDYGIGIGLDQLEQLLPDQVIEVAKQVEAFLLCVQSVCGDLSSYVIRYNNVMSSMPLTPAFNPLTATPVKYRNTPNYKLDVQNILSQSISSSQQQNNITTAKNSVTGAMNYGRGMVAKYWN